MVSSGSVAGKEKNREVVEWAGEGGWHACACVCALDTGLGGLMGPSHG